MKVLYTSDDSGCFGELEEVVCFKNEDVRNLTENEVQEILKQLVSNFGCSECVRYEIVSDDHTSTQEVYFDELFKCWSIK